MTTLKRERRRKFEAILSAFSDKLTRAEIEATAELLADAAESRTERKTDEAKAVPKLPEGEYFPRAWYVANGLPVPQGLIDQDNARDEALKAFERDMQCPSSWSWYPAKSSDESAWKALREFVIKLYQQDNKAFEKYYTWARDPFARGAKLPIHIRQDPTCFEYAWQAFRAAVPVVETTKREEGKSSGYYA